MKVIIHSIFSTIRLSFLRRFSGCRKNKTADNFDKHVEVTGEVLKNCSRLCFA